MACQRLNGLLRPDSFPEVSRQRKTVPGRLYKVTNFRILGRLKIQSHTLALVAVDSVLHSLPCILFNSSESRPFNRHRRRRMAVGSNGSNNPFPNSLLPTHRGPPNLGGRERILQILGIV